MNRKKEMQIGWAKQSSASIPSSLSSSTNADKELLSEEHSIDHELSSVSDIDGTSEDEIEFRTQNTKGWIEGKTDISCATSKSHETAREKLEMNQGESCPVTRKVRGAELRPSNTSFSRSQGNDRRRNTEPAATSLRRTAAINARKQREAEVTGPQYWGPRPQLPEDLTTAPPSKWGATTYTGAYLNFLLSLPPVRLGPKYFEPQPAIQIQTCEAWIDEKTSLEFDKVNTTPQSLPSKVHNDASRATSKTWKKSFSLSAEAPSFVPRTDPNSSSNTISLPPKELSITPRILHLPNKKWVSPSEKVLMMFDYAQKTWLHMRLQDCPYIPKEAKEYMFHKEGWVRTKSHIMKRKIEIAEHEAEASLMKVKTPFREKPLWQDGGSSVLADQTFWQPLVSVPLANCGPWPNHKALKQEGTSRAQHGLPRRLPQPRMRALDINGKELPWEDGEPIVFSKFDSVWTLPDEDSKGKTVSSSEVLDEDTSKHLLGESLLEELDDDYYF